MENLLLFYIIWTSLNIWMVLQKRWKWRWYNYRELMFREIRSEREHNCTICNRHIQEPKAHNFDHIKTKGSRTDLRTKKENIQIVCFKCHFEKHNGGMYKGIDFD